MVSEDANFKMKGCDRSSREKDPTLGPGWVYMVASNKYLNFLVNHINEDEVRKIFPVRCNTEFTILQISHCVSFAALWSANNKYAKGLRASGIGSVSCSRHEVFRPLGTGDLQRGEWCVFFILSKFFGGSFVRQLLKHGLSIFLKLNGNNVAHGRREL
jgi:hypothetical protein